MMKLTITECNPDVGFSTQISKVPARDNNVSIIIIPLALLGPFRRLTLSVPEMRSKYVAYIPAQ